MTPDERADLGLLTLANEKGKFAMQLGYTPSPAAQAAFERGIDLEWFTLVDLAPVAEYPDRLFRVFRLTLAGHARHKELLDMNEVKPWHPTA
jgi:hypothetical protein